VRIGCASPGFEAQPAVLNLSAFKVAAGVFPTGFLIFFKPSATVFLECIMRTDVKVGVVAVVVLVLLVVVYFAFIRHSASTADDNIVPTQQPELTQGPTTPDNGLGGAEEIPPTSQPDMGSGFNTPGSATQPDLGSTTQSGLGATTQTVLGGDTGMNGTLNVNGTTDNGQPGQTTLTINSYSLAAQDYTIQQGDTLVAISKRIYGSIKFIKAIERANPGLDPRRLRVGQKIHLPPQTGSPPTGAGMEELGGTNTDQTNGLAGTGAAATSAATSQTYVVKPGDNLRAIALKFYHRASLWTLIYHANHGVIGDDPNNVRVGEQLIIPAQQ
jgi:nucleoid-associated protein YgaU